MHVTDSQVDLLARLLDVATMRHEVIAQNVANVNTPGYRRQDVAFDEAFTRALQAGHEEAALRVTPQVIERGGAAERADGNNVDVDVEMGQLQKNTILYEVFAQLLAGQLATMRSAISGN
jgi:flagellar basal-body rod protein FlgB